MNGSTDINDISAQQAQNLASYSNILLGLANHVVNVKQNKRNLALIERQNAQAAAESEKAYQRSKPTTQVANMRQVGMSQAAAINALNGGGSYTPAPVAAGQEQMLDFSGMQNALANMAQVGLANAQLKEQKRQFNETLQFEKEKYANDEELRGANLRQALANAGIAEAAEQVSKIESEIATVVKEERITAEQKKILAETANAILTAYRDEKVYNAMNRMSDQSLQNLLELQAVLNMIQVAVEFDATDKVVSGLTKAWEFGKKVFGKKKIK